MTFKNSQKAFVSASLVLASQFSFSSLSLNDYYEVEVEANLAEGESREIQVGPQKDDAVLLVKVEGQYYCVSNKCSHFGAPLSQGPLIDDKVLCPWHNAAFSVKTGAAEQGPMLDGINTFPVTIQGDKVRIRVNKDLLNKKRTMNMVTRGDDPTHVVILGGGIAGQSAAESLRQAGFRGRITILTAEEHPPYDRTGMSKALFLTGPAGSQVRPKEFYEKYGIEVQTNTRVEGVDYSTHTLKIAGGKTVQYDKLLLATGGTARKPNVEGVNLQNIHPLRTVSDAHNISKAARQAKNIVIIGSSFIGLESASSIKQELKDGVNITVVDATKVAFERSLGTEVGGALQQLHQSKGINFALGQSLAKFEGKDKVERVVLADGTVLEADLVVLGTGIAPNVGFLGNINISQTNGGVETDVFLRTSQPNVYAAGDIASFPYWYSGDRVRIEHHSEAINQGFIAAMNIVGKPTAVSNIPYFWTRHYDRTLQYSGVAHKFDEVIVHGDLKDKFVAYYVQNGRVHASASVFVPQAQQYISEALRLNIMPSADELRSGKANLETIKAALKARAGSCKCKREQIAQASL